MDWNSIRKEAEIKHEFHPNHGRSPHKETHEISSIDHPRVLSFSNYRRGICMNKQQRQAFDAYVSLENAEIEGQIPRQIRISGFEAGWIAAMNDQEYEEWKRSNPGTPMPSKPRPFD